MRCKRLLPLVIWLATTHTAWGQTVGWHFQWHAGQTVTYRVTQETSATELIEGKKTESKSKLESTKAWEVMDVDSAGVATLRLTLRALRMETTTPAGEALIFDSSQPDKSDAQLKEQVGKYLQKPMALLRVDPWGKVVEVKECQFGSAARFQSEPPFVVIFPENSRSGSWELPFQGVLEAPQGSGQKYDGTKKYVCRSVDGPNATVVLKTILKNQPAEVQDRIPLCQVQPEGEIVFDFKAGMMRSAHLRISQEIKGHQGEGSSYQFQSDYREQLEENK